MKTPTKKISVRPAPSPLRAIVSPKRQLKYDLTPENVKTFRKFRKSERSPESPLTISNREAGEIVAGINLTGTLGMLSRNVRALNPIPDEEYRAAQAISWNRVLRSVGGERLSVAERVSRENSASTSPKSAKSPPPASERMSPQDVKRSRTPDIVRCHHGHVELRPSFETSGSERGCVLRDPSVNQILSCEDFGEELSHSSDSGCPNVVYQQSEVSECDSLLAFEIIEPFKFDVLDPKVANAHKYVPDLCGFETLVDNSTFRNAQNISIFKTDDLLDMKCAVVSVAIANKLCAGVGILPE